MAQKMHKLDRDELVGLKARAYDLRKTYESLYGKAGWMRAYEEYCKVEYAIGQIEEHFEITQKQDDIAMRMEEE